MRQVLQAVSGGGGVRVADVPVPVVGPTEVLVRSEATIVSAGTERAITALARSGLLAKARARPDLVRKVADRARTDGVGSAVRSVRARLDTDIPLGYSGCGRAVEVGGAVAGIRPGDLVATGGAGRANHAEFQSVPGLLCTRVPPGVPASDAAFTTIASIALHGLRLAEVGPGAKVVVIGLGLVGQLAARLALASGCDVVGIDLADLPLATAERAGVRALREAGDATTAAVRSWSRGRGADAVLICAAGRSGDPVRRATSLARDRAQLVVVGDVGLDLEREPFYERELSLRFARSYGPGRYDRGYEDWGVDYPPGHVRWTEGRNQEAVLDLLAAARLCVADLVTHAYPIDAAARAYQLVASRAEPYLAIRFDYPDAYQVPDADPLRGASSLPDADPLLGSNPLRDAETYPERDPAVPVAAAGTTGPRPPAAVQAAPGARTEAGGPGGPGGVAADVELPSQRHRAGPRPGPRADAGCRIGGVGWIGAGAFSGAVLLPAFRAAGFDRFVSVASAGGRSAQAFADRHEFAAAAADARAVIDDDGVGVVVIATSHASHAELTVAALERGRHVWCEKPPALTLAELDAVEHAARVGGGVLMVGFNRRFAPAVLAARRRLADRSGPLSIVYRVAAGPVPTEHWYADRRQGGRLLGEVCHFVDTCAVLAGSPVEAVTALAGREAEALLAPDLAVSMRHVDGTLSTVAYSSARPARVGKESIEALAGDRRVRIDDFRRLVVDGHTDWHGAQDKGHRAAVRAFRSRCLSGDGDADAGPGPDRGPYRGPDRGGDDGGAPGSGAGRAGSGRPGRPAAAGLTAELLASSRATLAAAVSLGGPLVPMPAPAGPAPAGPAPAVPAPAGPAADGRGSSGPPRPAAPDDRDIAKETRRA